MNNRERPEDMLINDPAMAEQMRKNLPYVSMFDDYMKKGEPPIVKRFEVPQQETREATRLKKRIMKSSLQSANPQDLVAMLDRIEKSLDRPKAVNFSLDLKKALEAKGMDKTAIIKMEAEFKQNMPPEAIQNLNNYVANAIQKGWKGSLAGGIAGLALTGGNPIGAGLGVYLGNKLGDAVGRGLLTRKQAQQVQSNVQQNDPQGQFSKRLYDRMLNNMMRQIDDAIAGNPNPRAQQQAFNSTMGNMVNDFKNLYNEMKAQQTTPAQPRRRPDSAFKPEAQQTTAQTGAPPAAGSTTKPRPTRTRAPKPQTTVTPEATGTNMAGDKVETVRGASHRTGMEANAAKASEAVKQPVTFKDLPPDKTPLSGAAETANKVRSRVPRPEKKIPFKDLPPEKQTDLGPAADKIGKRTPAPVAQPQAKGLQQTKPTIAAELRALGYPEEEIGPMDEFKAEKLITMKRPYKDQPPQSWLVNLKQLGYTPEDIKSMNWKEIKDVVYGGKKKNVIPPPAEKETPPLSAKRRAVTNKGANKKVAMPPIDDKVINKVAMMIDKGEDPTKIYKLLKKAGVDEATIKEILGGNKTGGTQKMAKGEIKPMPEKKSTELRKAIDSVNYAIDIISKGAPWVEQEKSLTPHEEGMGEEKKNTWLSHALEGGALGVLAKHPVVGQNIGETASKVGSKFLETIQEKGKAEDFDHADPKAIGLAILEALDGMVSSSGDDKIGKSWSNTMSTLIDKYGAEVVKDVAQGIAQEAGNKPMDTMHKAVAEPIGKDKFPAKNAKKAKVDFGGQSEVYGDGTNMDTESLTENSKKLETS